MRTPGRPAVLLVLEPERATYARIVSGSAADDVRLLDAIEHSDDGVAFLDAFLAARDELRRRCDGLTPADVLPDNVFPLERRHD